MVPYDFKHFKQEPAILIPNEALLSKAMCYTLRQKKVMTMKSEPEAAENSTVFTGDECAGFGDPEEKLR
ncbi:hypothetical protein L596_026610 [Steinernema carpocapsae]|uniref:Uncharacterized protein n=1 Tax=Steinernema carpocapsae TaxID=34508 RepID=A0A4U5M1W8_STECR|nr:hypothetical protein L596_026610 [Steinernema carpocapsae]